MTYYSEHKEEIRLQKQRFYAENREVLLKRSKIYYYSHKKEKEAYKPRRNYLRRLHRASRRIRVISEGELATMPKVCAVCGTTENICIDHDHKTEKFRGLLCRNHNLALGLLNDNPVYIKKLLSYLNQ